MNKHSPDMLRYTPALALEATISRRSLQQFHILFMTIGALCIGTIGYSQLISPLPIASAAVGIGFITGSILLGINLLRGFHNAFYYRGFAEGTGPKSGLTYEVARVFYLANGDLTASFVRAPQGYELMKRLGLSSTEIEAFLNAPRTKLTVSALPLPDNHYLTFNDLGLVIYEVDEDLRRTLSEHSVTESIYTGTLGWTTRAYYAYKQQKRWWAKDNLSRFAGLGREWSYGTAFLLQKYSRNLANNSIFSHLINDNAYASEKVLEIERILTRNREANVLLVGEAGVGKMDILLRVTERVRRKIAHPELLGKRFVLLDGDYLLSQHDTKQAFERTFLKMMQQTERAGNVIMVIENFSGFVRAGKSIDVDIPALLEPYLGAQELNLIFTDTPGAFHHDIEQLGILRKIDVLYVEPPSLLGTERLLEDIARRYEKQYHITLTYPALQAVAADADRYIPTGVMPDKAVDLLVEVMSAASQTDAEHVTAEFVQEFVAKKTGIPVGPIADEEREMLLEREDRLHKRVVGQEHAITAIASAMRRARAGIQDADRPLGSFLFMGPTGVGKTETAKALAAVFFNAEDAMQRLDMSEFSGQDGLERLLGNTDTSGVLSEMMHEHPYAVLLLDEFEKANQGVHDLFLQILDEGRYTDARGTTVNMRNTIIIATSNAGSNFIIEAVRSGTNLDSVRDDIVKRVIAEGTYRPELVNRFDGVIIFEPLSEGQQEVVAGYLLDELTSRIAERGYTLNLGEEVKRMIATGGYDPEFGARPMRRLIQDQIEEVIARKIISGALKKGSAITITKADLESAS